MEQQQVYPSADGMNQAQYYEQPAQEEKPAPKYWAWGLGVVVVICICIAVYVWMTGGFVSAASSKSITVKLRNGGSLTVANPGVYYLFDGWYQYGGQQNPSWFLMKEEVKNGKYVYTGSNSDSGGSFVIESDSIQTVFDTAIFAFLKTYPGSTPVLYIGAVQNNQQGQAMFQGGWSFFNPATKQIAKDSDKAEFYLTKIQVAA